MFQSKVIGWHNGLKTKIYLYTAYKRLTSDLDIYRLKVKG